MVKSFIRYLGSIRFTILLIILFALAVIAGTVIESKTGSHKLASKWIYSHPLFLMVLWGIFLNILFATFKRYPFNKSHIPFLITHLGLLMVFGGALLKISFGMQGTVTLKEGLSSDWAKVDDTYALSFRKRGTDQWQQIPLKRDLWGNHQAHYQSDELQVQLSGYLPHGEEKFQTWIKDNHLVIIGEPLYPLDKQIKRGSLNILATRDPEIIKKELKSLPALVFLEEPSGKLSLLAINEKGEINHEEYDPAKLKELYAYDEGFGGYTSPFKLTSEEIEAPLTRKFAPAPLPVKAEEERPLLSLVLNDGKGQDHLVLSFGSPLPTSALRGEYLFRFEPLRLKLPERIRLRKATASYYPNSQEVKGYHASIYAGGKKEELSMNEVWESDNGTRFYLANMSPLDESSVKEVRLVVNHDPFKRVLTYPGAGILALGIILLFTRRKR